ncbi:helix-turn-helix domain-containing protein [Nocardia sp. NPDC127526]|uniref:helix-turn-helix domain-containing protein n=1 Tax=Nocardia sp. NPDC127526 TaxID=3345393 RepID=UPI00363616E1
MVAVGFGDKGFGMLVHDTALIAPHERVEAVNAVFNDKESPQAVTYATEAVGRHRMYLYDLGPGVHVLRNSGTGLYIVRNARHVAQGAPEQFALFMQLRGSGLLTAVEGQGVIEPGRLSLLDTTRPYSYRQSASSDHKVVILEPGLLGLPVDVIRSAAAALPSSPVYPLVRAHFLELCNTPTELPEEAAFAVGQATVQLIRALVATAARDSRRGEAMDDSLLLRIGLFIDAHLHDPGLDPRRIAAAHSISVRQLYYRWSRAGHEPGLAEWILRRRLERAGQVLADPGNDAPIAAVVRACGFTNVSHFHRRFRERYGMTPREWREAHRLGEGVGQ